LRRYKEAYTRYAIGTVLIAEFDPIPSYTTQGIDGNAYLFGNFLQVKKP
jgi:hypothetical protein